MIDMWAPFHCVKCPSARSVDPQSTGSLMIMKYTAPITGSLLTGSLITMKYTALLTGSLTINQVTSFVPKGAGASNWIEVKISLRVLGHRTG